ncbi:MAG: HEAT repeat domain-containing protein, partial [Gemmatimonadetes bacterium]|nr:HEAT repeat domain-containing protein [Gemmatimonadota bacterium]
IRSKGIRQADLSEQIAFFESYGLVQDPDGVKVLDRLLNGRGFLGRKESGEIRACAALALGKMDSPEAAAALEKASEEQDPVVRSAVGRALRGEG